MTGMGDILRAAMIAALLSTFMAGGADAANSEREEEGPEETDGGEEREDAPEAASSSSSSDAATSSTSAWGRAYRGAAEADAIQRERDAAIERDPRSKAMRDFVSEKRAGFIRRKFKKSAQLAEDIGNRTEASKAGVLKDFDRVIVGEADGVLVQHMVNIYAAVGDVLPLHVEGDFSDNASLFHGEFRSDNLKSFEQGLLNVERRLPSNENASLVDRETLARAQASIASLRNEVKIIEGLDEGLNAKNFRERGPIRDAMERALLSAGGKFFDNISSEVSADGVSLGDLPRRGGQNAEVYDIVLDRQTGEVEAPTEDRPVNAVFKPEGVLANPDYMEKVGIRNGFSMRLALRQAVFFDVASLIGYGEGAGGEALVPFTEYARMDGKIGTVQSFAEGSQPFKTIYRTPDRAGDEYKKFDEALNTVGMSVEELKKSKSMTESDARAALDTARMLIDQNSARRSENDKRIIEVRVREDMSDEMQNALGDARLLRNLANAEVLDALCGQVDRNAGNFFITGDGKVTLIDNDQAFGLNVDPWRGAGSLPKKPAVMDLEMAERLKNLDPDILRSTTAGRLTTLEQDAMITRLGAIKAHIKQLEQQGKLIFDVSGVHGSRWLAELGGLSNRADGRYYAAIDGGGVEWNKKAGSAAD